MAKLVIVESPTKARTIGRFLGKEYDIKPSMGHVMDLPKSKLGVDLEHEFKPDLEIVEDKKPLIAELKRLAKGADMILLATDPDREGEAISANLQEILMDGKDKIKKDKFQRIVFHEITQSAIEHAIDSPRSVDVNLVDAQIARRVLDRLVGYQISPLLWRKVRRGLSAGRVQSIALRLIVEREKEIEKFTKEPYFSIHALLLKKGESTPVEFELIEINDEKIESSESFELYDGKYTISKTNIDTKGKADALIAATQGKPFVIADVAKREMRRSPQPPFTTSTLQQEASRRFGYPGKRTMSVAQKLYEEGFITYHRTDSVILSTQAVSAIREYVTKTYGVKYVPEKNRFYAAKQKLAQEAHESIRPTKIPVTAEQVKGELGSDYAKLYDLIWRRAVASQMSDAVIDSTTVFADTKDEKKSYRFKTNGSILLFDGFLKVNMQALQDVRLPDYKVGEDLTAKEVRADPHETPPPPRYNDASLIATLEEKGIGRPSTYASIISVISDRGYVERLDRRFAPTAVGIAVNDFLVENFSTIDDIQFTAQMEDELDEIADGKKEWNEMMKEFYTPFSKHLKEAGESDRVKIAVEETDEKCPDCKEGKLVIRTGRFGKFFSCSRFPDCKYTRQYAEETNLTCPKDGGKVVMKKTRRGRPFYGCENYPNCDFAAWKLEDITNGTADGGTTGKKKTGKVKKADGDETKPANPNFFTPQTVGKFEESDVQVAIGRFGPYVKHASKFYSIPRGEDIATVDEKRAIGIIQEKRESDKKNTLKTFTEDATVFVLNGRYGPYIKFGKKNIKIPQDTEPTDLTFEQVKALAAADGVTSTAKSPKKRSPKKKTAKKS